MTPLEKARAALAKKRKERPKDHGQTALSQASAIQRQLLADIKSKDLAPMSRAQVVRVWLEIEKFKQELKSKNAEARAERLSGSGSAFAEPTDAPSAATAHDSSPSEA